jgi:hypothetical protein
MPLYTDSFIIFAQSALVAVFLVGCEVTNTENIATGTVISTGFAPSLDAVATQVIDDTELAFGAPVKHVELDANRGTISAICHKKWCASVSENSRVVVSRIEGSQYWIVSELLNSDAEAKDVNTQEDASSQLISLPPKILDVYGKVVTSKGLSCDYVRSGVFFDRSQYKSPGYSGPIDYCIHCANEKYYLLSQFPDNSFSVFSCPDLRCSNCSSQASQKLGDPLS